MKPMPSRDQRERDLVLDVSLTVDYRSRPEVLKDAVLEVHRGEILGLVGASGCGKSTLALAVLRLLDWRGGVCRGRIWFEGRDLLALRESELRALRGRRIAMVPQNPHAALNPALRIGAQLEEAWRAHASLPAPLLDALEGVCLPPEHAFLRRYPRELSAGQAQRVLIAMAVLHRPALLVADEPTSSLDVITQAGILDLFARLNRERGAAILYISHDLPSVASLCHRLAILHEGRVVECGTVEDVFGRPRHPYTRRLIEALPRSPVDPRRAPHQAHRLVLPK